MSAEYGLMGAYRGKSRMSRTIKFATCSKYSHVSHIEAKVLDGRMVGPLWEIESVGGMGVCKVQYPGYNHTPGTRVDLFRLKQPLTDEQHEKLVKGLHAELGKKYDWWGIIGFLLRAKINDPAEWFCSELLHAKYGYAGLWIQERIASSKVSPERMVNSPLWDPAGYMIVGEGMRVYASDQI